MSRVYVNLTVLSAHADAVEKILEEHGEHPDLKDDIKNIDGANVVSFGITDIHDGFLDSTNVFIKEGIPFNIAFENTTDKEQGTHFGRFTPTGELEEKTIYSSDLVTNTSFVHKHLVEGRIDELLKFTTDKEKLNEVLPWKDQLRFSKIYLLREMVETKQ